MARKAALYLRSSKDRHDVSVASQGRELRNHATEVGDIIVAEFSDRVESAKTDDRPGFQSMITHVKQKKREFDVVYCFHRPVLGQVDLLSTKEASASRLLSRQLRSVKESQRQFFKCTSRAGFRVRDHHR